MKSITFAIPTHDEKRPLERCLKSIAGQLEPQDQVLVIGDTCDGPLPKVEQLVENFGAQFRYLAYDAGYHDWGHSQLNYGMTQATTDYWHANDDDDIYLPDAVSLMHKGIEQFPGQVLLFRFISQFGTIYWDELGRLERDHVGGHCIVAPITDYRQMGTYGSVYSGDYDYVAQTVFKHGGPEKAVWLTDLICQARPYQP